MNKKINITFPIVSVMLAFFVMGFVDLVGIATNYVKKDFALSDTVANLLPSMVFLWFLIFSIPTSVLMSKIGQRKTVIISIFITSISLIIPCIEYSFTSMLISFALLGIGNTLMQVSLNPLLTSIVSGDRLASSLTFGQFIKAIASLIAPLIAAWGAEYFNSWILLFPIFFAISTLTVLLLFFTEIKESGTNKTSTFSECFSLMNEKVMLFFFIGIMCHVGIDVGTNVTAPKLLIEHLSLDITEAGYITSWYFIFRTIGCFAGAFLLAIFPSKRIFRISILMMLVAIVVLFISHNKIIIYTCIALIGVGNSNVFPVIMSQALLRNPNKQNQVSGLMITGLFGGALFPLLMGVASDYVKSQSGALIVLGICVLFLLFLITQLKTIKVKS